MKFERQYNFAYFCNLSVSTNKGTFILKNNMPDTIQFHIWYQKAKYPKTYIRAWCILQNGSTWSQIVENSVEIWFNNIMFFAKVSTPTISWSKKAVWIFWKMIRLRTDTAKMCFKSWSFLENSDNPLYAHTLIIKKGKCNAGFLNA